MAWKKSCLLTRRNAPRVSIDSYMNIQLANAEEHIKNNFAGSLGQVLIRCNNVLWDPRRGRRRGERRHQDGRLIDNTKRKRDAGEGE